MPEDRLFLLLNRVRPGDRRRVSVTAKLIAEGVGFEIPVIGVIPDAHPYVAVAQSRGELPHSWMIDELEAFRSAIDEVAERLGLMQSRPPHPGSGPGGLRAVLCRVLRGFADVPEAACEVRP